MTKITKNNKSQGVPSKLEKWKITGRKQSKNWCFTEHNLDVNLVSIYNENKDIMAYLCWGVEVCPKTKKTHYQGWFQFLNKKRFGGVKKIFTSAHFEMCNGTEEQNDEYCGKENDFHTLGKYTIQGARSDLEALKRMIDNGNKMDDIINKNFSLYCRYKNGIESYFERVQRRNIPSWRTIKVIYLWGTTGTGKTRMAMTNDPDDTYKIGGYALKHWNFYENEKTIVIDDYNNDVNITYLLLLLDGYKLRLNTKFGFTNANWNKVYITSNLNPNELHANAKPAHRKALFRRLSSVIKMEHKVKLLQVCTNSNKVELSSSDESS